MKIRIKYLYEAPVMQVMDAKVEGVICTSGTITVSPYPGWSEQEI